MICPLLSNELLGLGEAGDGTSGGEQLQDAFNGRVATELGGQGGKAGGEQKNEHVLE